MHTLHRRGFMGCLLGGAALSLSPEQDALSRFKELLAGVSEDQRYWEIVKSQFSLTPGLIYMNNGGLGPSPIPVTEAVITRMRDLEKISESGHHLVKGIRAIGARFFNCQEEELAFTRSTTEGMNIIARGLSLKKGDEVLMSTHEHPGGALPWLALMEEKGIRINSFEPGRNSSETLDRITEALTPKTRVLMASHVTCTLGDVLPVKEISHLCRQCKVISVFDGAQAPGQIPVDLEEISCDFYATSGHKWLLGPKGTGFVYINRSLFDAWRPTYVGAYSDKGFSITQQKVEFLRSAGATEYGTRNTPLVVGLGAALNFLNIVGGERIKKRIRSMTGYLRQELNRINNMEILSQESGSAIVTFRLNKKNFDPWAVTQQLKRDFKIRLRPVGENDLKAIRISLFLYNTYDELNTLIKALKKIA